MAEGQVIEQPADDSEAALVDRIVKTFAPDEPEEEVEAPETEVEAEAPEPEPEGDAVDPDAPFIPVKVKAEGGTDQDELLSINQLKSGYMMQKDYQRKTAELARARDTLTQEVEQAVSQERQSYLQGLQVAEQALLNMVVPELNGVDIEKLAQTDPAKAVAIQARAHKLNQTVQAIRGQIAQAAEQARKAQAEQSKRALSDPVSGVPGWGDQLYNQIISEAKDYGFSTEEVANVVDHRMIRVLHDALQYRKAKTAKPKDQVKAVPKVLKPGTPQGKSALQAQNEAQLSNRLQKSGSIEDAAALYLARRK